MNQAGTNGQGINLPNLLNALKQVQNQIPSDQMAPADPASRQQVMEMMNRIGIPVDPNSAEPLNLEQLISKIERMVALGHRPAADENTLLRDLYQFITNLKPSARGTDTKDVTVVADDEGLASSGPSLNIRKPGLSPQQQQLLDSMSADQKPSNAKNEFQPSYMKPAEDQLELDRMEIQGLKADTGWEKTISKQAVGDLLIGGAGRSETASTQSQTLVSGTKLPGYVLNQVGSQILKARLNNENEVTLQLKPPHLGRIFMTIENQMDGLKVSVITEQQAAREMLQSHMHELRSLLNEQGLRLEKLDVELSQNFEQTMTSARQGHNRRKERRRGSAANIVKKNTISAAEALAPKNGVNEGVLHLLA
jgi:hypothetical protein